MKPLRTPPSALLTLAAIAALALPCAALPLGLRLAARAAAVEAQTNAETPEERAYRIYAPNTAFEVTVTNGTEFAFTLSLLSGHASATVDWGDGSTSEYTADGTASHTYAADGSFVVKISDDVRNFRVYAVAASRPFATAALRWGDSLTSCESAFRECVNLSGFIPRWGKSVVSAVYTYHLCAKLHGTVPAWNDDMIYVNVCYWMCTGLTGTIPPWPKNLINCQTTYSGCSGLTGDIPPWPPKVKNASFTYMNTKGITGAWTDDPAELMPTNITSHIGCVFGSFAALRALFYSDWGGTREKPVEE